MLGTTDKISIAKPQLDKNIYAIDSGKGPAQTELLSDSRLMRQPRSALCASARQHLTAVCRAHSLAEAMLLLSLNLFRLISSQHYSTPPYIVASEKAPTAYNATTTSYIIHTNMRSCQVENKFFMRFFK